jgi:pyrimidine operon attenuation protein / uracil phosphoribosyltransferase
MTAMQNSILSGADIRRRLRRMAIEVAEHNTGETALVVAGVAGNGMVVARQLITELTALLPVTISLVEIVLDKGAPLDVSVTPAQDFSGKNILIVDDVANSGRTLLYAVKPFLQFQPKKIQTLVLVERSHKVFPVTSDFVGLSLSTTLQEHITVATEGEEIIGAWLH